MLRIVDIVQMYLDKVAVNVLSENGGDLFGLTELDLSNLPVLADGFTSRSHVL
jgi:hypothetical protein